MDDHAIDPAVPEGMEVLERRSGLVVVRERHGRAGLEEQLRRMCDAVTAESTFRREYTAPAPSRYLGEFNAPDPFADERRNWLADERVTFGLHRGSSVLQPTGIASDLWATSSTSEPSAPRPRPRPTRGPSRRSGQRRREL